MLRYILLLSLCCGFSLLYPHSFIHPFLLILPSSWPPPPLSSSLLFSSLLPRSLACQGLYSHLNLSKNTAKTISSFTNCIITGGRKQSLMVATPLPEYYEGRFDGNYLRSDSLNEAFAANNVYALESDSCVFKNIYYLYKKYHYYDFHLDSVSPARGIGDSIAALSYPMDREGVQRKAKPDAGCYEFSL